MHLSLKYSNTSQNRIQSIKHHLLRIRIRILLRIRRNHTNSRMTPQNRHRRLRRQIIRSTPLRINTRRTTSQPRRNPFIIIRVVSTDKTCSAEVDIDGGVCWYDGPRGGRGGEVD